MGKSIIKIFEDMEKTLSILEKEKNVNLENQKNSLKKDVKTNFDITLDIYKNCNGQKIKDEKK